MKFLFIISGSIAAKKCIKILSILTNKGMYINCIVTDSAKKLINSSLIKHSIKGRVYYNSSEKNNKMLHIKLTRISDLIIVCPATANLIAKFVHGYADDLASTSLIASNKKIIIIPAMNVEMWNNSINQDNIYKLKKKGIEFIGPDYGYLSCGEKGLGRLTKENKIIQVILNYAQKTKKLKDKTCIVTAGPTIESIDPIRYISNFSSGKQGYEIAKQLSLSGAKVTLITGPTNLQPPSNVKIINIITAEEMYKTVRKCLKTDIAIFTAAVSDIKPTKKIKQKIKREKFKNITLMNNPDIVKKICSSKKLRPQLVISFAAETENLITNATKKIKAKGSDWIVGNKIDKNNRVFGSDFNKIILISNNKILKFKKMTKINIAKLLVNKIIDNFKNNNL